MCSYVYYNVESFITFALGLSPGLMHWVSSQKFMRVSDQLGTKCICFIPNVFYVILRVWDKGQGGKEEKTQFVAFMFMLIHRKRTARAQRGQFVPPNFASGLGDSPKGRIST